MDQRATVAELFDDVLIPDFLKRRPGHGEVLLLAEPDATVSCHARPVS
jgi:hypothetical protein